MKIDLSLSLTKRQNAGRKLFCNKIERYAAGDERAMIAGFSLLGSLCWVFSVGFSLLEISLEKDEKTKLNSHSVQDSRPVASFVQCEINNRYLTVFHTGAIIAGRLVAEIELDRFLLGHRVVDGS